MVLSEPTINATNSSSSSSKEGGEQEPPKKETVDDDSKKRKASSADDDEPKPVRKRNTIRKDESLLSEEEKRKLEEKRAYSRKVSQRARQRTKDEIVFLAAKAEKQTARVDQLETELKEAKDQVRRLTADNERLSALATRALGGAGVGAAAGGHHAGLAAGANLMGMGPLVGPLGNQVLMQQLLAAGAGGFGGFPGAAAAGGANPALAAALAGLPAAAANPSAIPPGGVPGVGRRLSGLEKEGQAGPNGGADGEAAAGAHPSTNPLVQRADEDLVQSLYGGRNGAH